MKIYTAPSTFGNTRWSQSMTTYTCHVPHFSNQFPHFASVTRAYKTSVLTSEAIAGIHVVKQARVQ